MLRFRLVRFPQPSSTSTAVVAATSFTTHKALMSSTSNAKYSTSAFFKITNNYYYYFLNANDASQSAIPFHNSSRRFCSTAAFHSTRDDALINALQSLRATMREMRKERKEKVTKLCNLIRLCVLAGVGGFLGVWSKLYYFVMEKLSTFDKMSERRDDTSKDAAWPHRAAKIR